MSKPNILRVDDPRVIEIFTNHRAALRQQLVAEGLGGLIQEQDGWLRAFKREGRIQQSGVRAANPSAHSLEIALLVPDAYTISRSTDRGTQKKLVDYRLLTQRSTDVDGIEKRDDTDFQCNLSTVLQGKEQGALVATTYQKDAEGTTGYDSYRHTTTETTIREARLLTTPEELDIVLATSLARISLPQYGIELPQA